MLSRIKVFLVLLLALILPQNLIRCRDNKKNFKINIDFDGYSFKKIFDDAIKFPSAIEYLVDTNNLPDVNFQGKLVQYAGLLPVFGSENPNDKLFFWYFESKNIRSNDLGQDGASSVASLLAEHGPFSGFDRQAKKLTNNPNSWHQDAHIVYVDQPLGVGFSNLAGHSKVEDETQVGETIFNFLVNFFRVFPHLRNKDIYLAGESYAGFYIPYAAASIIKNGELDKRNKFRLKGISISSATIDQYFRQVVAAVIPYAEEQKLINSTNQELLQGLLDRCMPTIGNTKSSEATGIDYTYGFGKCDVAYAALGIIYKSNPNPPPPFLLVNSEFDYNAFLQNPKLLEQIHLPANSSPWELCTNKVLKPDNSLVAVNIIPSLTEHIKVVIWSGDKDASVTHIGTEFVIGNMSWGGETGFKNNELQPIFDEQDNIIGKIHTERNLTYVLVHDAGHLVNIDQPKTSRFILQKVVLDDPLKLEKLEK
ncbi:1497_t:CDS:10 [Ambispora leptoticha]|uniref:Carboxypeptidase n=1 Tax=Ambispora leptoticha TaxID=144679 RepID=A0A9N8ZLV6_9GLOM|nr:1497_t:CDS:10 [Ambispora leptoticha]